MTHFYLVNTFDHTGTIKEHTFYIDIYVAEGYTAKNIFDRLSVAVGNELEKLGLSRYSQFKFYTL